MAKAKEGLRRDFSAGGVVFRKKGGKTLWLLGKHSGYHKWVLPKGIIEKGEKGLATAVREVKEEMGVNVRPTGSEPIHKVSYFYWDGDTKILKQVNFYLMEYEAGDIREHGWEMEDVRWLPYKQAHVKLAFEGEKEALKRAHETIE